MIKMSHQVGKHLQVFFIHIKKTSGTSFRNMLYDVFKSEQIYPTPSDLTSTGNIYATPNYLMEMKGQGKLININVLCGHYPFILGEKIFTHPTYITFLRHPIERTLSVIEQHKNMNAIEIKQLIKSTSKITSGRFIFPEIKQDTSYEEALDSQEFVECLIKNYQTKIFVVNTLDEAPDTLNISFRINDLAYQRAIERLDLLDVIGLTEEFNTSIQLIESELDIKFPTLRYLNRSKNQNKRNKLNQKLVNKIIDLTEYDIRLYEEAVKRFYNQIYNSKM